MAKAKKGASDGGATKKQATETKKAASESKAQASAPKTTKAAASTTKASATAEKPSAAAGAATKKKAPAKSTSGGAPSSGSMPLIDTSLAAQTAANFVANRALLGNAAANAGARQDEDVDDAQSGDKRESSTFKQLKAGLNKPASQGVGGLLGNSTSGKKGNTGFGGGNQQVGRNQTFGADVNRSGVPRRTGG